MWKGIVKEYKLEKDIKILSWCAYDSDFPPNKLDPRFKLWIKKAITSLSGITQENEIMSFQLLKEKFSLEKEDFYRYLQLRNYHSQNVKRKSNREDSKALNQLFTEAYKSEINRNIISQLSKSLHNLNNYSTRYIKDKWEKEGGLTIADEEWQNICQLQWKTTKSHLWKEFCWKNVTQFFITPSQKVHYI